VNTATATYEPGLADHVATFARRRNAFLGAVAGVLLAAVAVSALWPSVYRSSATILIEQQEIPPELVRSTVTSYADQRLQTIKARVMTGENLLGIADEFDLYPRKRERLAREELLEEIRANIALDIVSAEVMDPRRGVPTNATIAFMVSFDDEDAEKAYRVANELTSLYLNANLSTRTEHAKDATVFLEAESERLSRDVAELESKLAAFKENHGDALPEMFEVNVQTKERLERDLEDVERALATQRERLVYLESELALQSPYMSLISETGERLLGPADRLKSLEAQLAGMLGVYSEAHPDVKRTRESIAGLRAEVDDLERRRNLAVRLEATNADLAAIRERYSDDHPEVKVLRAQVDALLSMMDETVTGPVSAPSNPAYVQLKAQLDGVRLERAAHEQRKREVEAKLVEVEGRLARAPQVDSQYRELSANLQNARTKLLQVRDKAMEARLGQSLEADRKGERFTLIDPAQLPEKPVSPNRALILSLGLVLSIVAGAITVVAYEALDQRVFGLNMTTALLGAPPLAAIPVISTSEERRVRTHRRRTAFVVVCLVGALVLTLTHVFVMPLDTATFALARKYGW
jgi:uncharacterized protein involved in exopolysaccharide biosynthesis